MPATEAFGPDDYADTRTTQRRDDERQEVERQVRSLLRMETDNEHRVDVVAKLHARRRGDSGRVQIETVARSGHVDVVVASRSLVARSADLTEDALTMLRADFGISCSPGERRVVQLDVSRDEHGADRVTDVLDGICGCGTPAALNYVVPLAGWVKGDGGPEPSAGARPFPAVRITEATPSPVVAVLDTGISSEARGDKYLAMHVDPDDLDPLDDFPPDGLLDAGAGHGSFVAGIVQQVAPTAPVHIHRLIDSDGITTDMEVAEMMRRAVREGATILNMSLGTGTVDGQPPLAMLDAVTELAQEHPEVLVVCAAGNGPGDEEVWPAAFARDFPNVVAVAALDPSGEGAAWSRRGDWVTCSAVGEGVVSTYVIGTEDGPLIDDPDPDTFGPDSWATWSGTSFAAPQIAGAVARIVNESAEPLTPRQALDELLGRGTPIRGYGSALRILPGT